MAIERINMAQEASGVLEKPPKVGAQPTAEAKTPVSSEQIPGTSPIPDVFARAFTEPENRINTGGDVEVDLDDPDFLRILNETGGIDPDSSEPPIPPSPPEPPDGPRGPEGGANRELDFSPERGRWLCDEVIRYRTTMAYQERYNEVNGPRYTGILSELQLYVNEICRVRNNPTDFGPQKAYPKPTYVEVDVEVNGQIQKVRQLKPPEFPDIPQQVEALHETMAQLRGQHTLQGAQESEQEVIPDLPPLPPVIETQEALELAFQHAEKQGLLREVNAVLNSIHEELTITVAREGVITDRAESLLEIRTARAKRLARTVFNERRRNDPSIPEQLLAVLEPYIDLAQRRIEKALNGQPPTEPMVGEWRPPSPEQTDDKEFYWGLEVSNTVPQERKTYWEQSGYIKYYRVTAQTQEQFLTAKESFFRMIRAGRLGKAPGALFEHVKNFIEAFALQGEQQVGKTVSGEFITNTRLELEALLYVFVGNYANEVYDHKQRHGAMDAMAKDEGPQRWAALYRANKGGVAVFTHLFDKENLMDIYNNPMAERGELDLVAGHFLQDRIQEMVIERGMGIVLKDYDPRDEYFSSDDLQAKIAAATELESINAEYKKVENAISTGAVRLKMGDTIFDKMYEGDEKAKVKRARAKLRRNSETNNLKRIGLTKNAEEFKSLFEGFENGDYHTQNYLRYKEDVDLFKADQELPETQRQYQRKYPAFDKLPESIKRSIDLGRIQMELRKIRQHMVNNPNSVKPGLEKGQTALDFLSPRDKEVYEAAYAEAAGNFEIAFEMQGVQGEKARRGRGYLMVEKNDHVRYFYNVADEQRLQWIEIDRDKNGKPALVQNGRGIRDIMVYMDDNFAQILPSLVDQSLKPEDQEKEMALQRTGKAEFDEFFKSLSAEKQRSLKVGWMLAAINDGKELSTFSQEYKDLYRGLSPKEKHVYRDSIATYQVENFVQWGIFYTKMKYADRPARFRKQKVEEIREKLIEQVRTKGYEAPLLDDEGKPMVFKRPLGIFDATGQFKKVQLGDRLGFNAAGQEVLLALDQEGKIQNLQYDPSGKAIIFDKASGADKKRVNTHLVNTSRVTTVEGTLVENVKATFEIAAESDDFRNRHIEHTYLYYQGNTKDTLLTPEIEAAAWRIWKGISRPGDEDKLALQRVLADPTMRRIRKIDNDKGQKREKFLIAGAVLESTQGAMRTRKRTYRAFTSRDGNQDRMMAGYRQEDWAGMDRFTFGYVEFAAEQTLRLARRLGAGIWFAPFEQDSGPARWGVHGIGEGIALMADEIKKTNHQPHIGQFALTKANDVLAEAVNMYTAWVGQYNPQTGEWEFGLAEKPTDNNDAQNKHTHASLERHIAHDPAKATEFFYDQLKTFGRLKRVTKIQRHALTDIDNASGAVDLENQEVFLPDGRFNSALYTISRRVLSKNGVARARQGELLDDYDEWLLDQRPGGGGDVYRRDLWWNQYLPVHMAVYQGSLDYAHGPTFAELRNDKII